MSVDIVEDLLAHGKLEELYIEASWVGPLSIDVYSANITVNEIK